MTSNDFLEKYRQARTRFNKVNEQEKILNQQKCFIVRKSINKSRRTKKKTISSFRLSLDIRRLFNVERNSNENVEIKTLSSFSTIEQKTTTPVRFYPPTIRLESIEKKTSIDLKKLDEIRFIGQFDRKFLVTKRFVEKSNSNRVELILFDQHAISERILLERLQNYFQEKTSRCSSFSLSVPILISRNPRFIYSDDQIALLERTGFHFSSISNRNLLVRAVPTWILSFTQRSSLLHSTIRQTIDEILKNLSSKTNETMEMNLNFLVYHTLKSLACHNAIKFNDVLSKSDVNELFNELKHCSMPFICAHGRTSAALLWQYDRIDQEDYRVNMSQLEEIASIHKWMKNS